MNIDALISILKNGGVVTIDGSTWSIDKAHAEDDMPEELMHPLSDDESDDDWFDRQSAWWDTLEACNDKDTKTVVLLEALCRLAGVRVREA